MKTRLVPFALVLALILTAVIAPDEGALALGRRLRVVGGPARLEDAGVVRSQVASGGADESVAACGVRRRLHSASLAESRIVNIRLPRDYAQSDKRYPVLYKLDGDSSVFLQTVAAVEYLGDWYDWVPDHIIVGIENTDRVRDMDPWKGADKFIRFLKDELVPFIDSRYRTSGFRLLCGQSASATFTLYAFLRAPEAFDAYVLSSLGLAPSGNARGRFEADLLKMPARTKGRAFLYVANGKMDAYDKDGARTANGLAFLDSLEKAAAASIQVRRRSYDDEGHVPFPTIYDALKWIYAAQGPAGDGQSRKPSASPATHR